MGEGKSAGVRRFLDLCGYNISAMHDQFKPLHWVGSSKKDLLDIPDDFIDVFGFALHLAQTGKKHDQAKPLKGFGGAPACWRWWKTTWAVHTGRSTR